MECFLDEAKYWYCVKCSTFAITRDELVHTPNYELPLYLIGLPNCGCSDGTNCVEMTASQFDILREEMRKEREKKCPDDHMFNPEWDELDYDWDGVTTCLKRPK